MATDGAGSSAWPSFTKPSSPPYASSWKGRPASVPSLRYVHAWYGQRNVDAVPRSARHTCMPRCTHMLNITRTPPDGVAGHEERVVDDAAHHEVVAAAAISDSWARNTHAREKTRSCSHRNTSSSL